MISQEDEEKIERNARIAALREVLAEIAKIDIYEHDPLGSKAAVEVKGAAFNIVLAFIKREEEG